MLDINGCEIEVGCVSKNPLGDPTPVFIYGFVSKEDVIIETYSGKFYQIHQSDINVLYRVKLNKKLMNKDLPSD